MTDNAIEVIDLHKTYRKGRKVNNALNGINFTVKKGEAFGFVGANGAGKSTAIKVILDLVRADSGQVLINGIDSLNPLSRSRVSFMPENPHLSDYLTPLDVLRLGVNMHQLTVANMNDYCMHWLEKLGIADAANKTIRQLSKGMAQRTGLAHSLACQPQLLILDEPLSGLDPIGRVEVVDLLDHYCKDGGTLMFTSHVLHDVERIADSFALIDKGEIQSTKTNKELIFAGDMYKVIVYGDNVLTGFTPVGAGRFELEVSSDQLWSTLRSIETSQHHLVSVTPVLNLERLFLDIAR
jgi:ABC-2 type transport system ATP-binding protein